ncbi:MAG: hypothetical protein H0V20_07575 [Actinobacteria bacterium]|nr:hypothetical protein [Actinomycetota bacterium]
MWKLLFLARRGWKMIPREQRRQMRKRVFTTARKHGPVIVTQARKAAKQARKTRP